MPKEAVSFAFSGCAPLAAAGVRALTTSEPCFEETLRECDAIFAEETDWTLWDALGSVSAGESVTQLPLIFPLNVAVQIAMFRLLRRYGLDARTVIGASSGEVSAACAAGAISLRDALRVAIHGGRFMDAQARQFRMAQIWMSVSRYVNGYRAPGDGIEIAALMDPGCIAICGESAAVDRLLGKLTDAGVRAQVLPFPWGAHTSALRDGRDSFERALQSLPRSRPHRRIFSTASVCWEDDGFSLQHWWHMFSQPVSFMPAVKSMIAGGVKLFIEVGPTTAMSHVIPMIGARAISFPQALAVARQSEAEPVQTRTSTG